MTDDSAEWRCRKCGCATKGEEALVDGQIWCHPCADELEQGTPLTVDYHPIDANTPPPREKRLLLWFIGRNAPKAAHFWTIGTISAHQIGEVWIDGDYRPVEWFSHWRLLPDGPESIEDDGLIGVYDPTIPYIDRMRRE